MLDRSNKHGWMIEVLDELEGYSKKQGLNMCMEAISEAKRMSIVALYAMNNEFSQSSIDLSPIVEKENISSLVHSRTRTRE